MEALAEAGSQHHDRLFRFAMSKFDSAILSTPDNTHMLNHYAHVLKKVAILKTNAGQSPLLIFMKLLH